MCSKVSWLGDLNSRDQYRYFASVVSVVRFLQKYMIMGNDIVDTLHKITIDNSKGNRRGYATWNEVVINLGSIRSRIEFLQLVAHEM
ncbi:hypothetical protein KKG31_07695 [Patescibacteria group bacterium]|nr:hypothetical protein [Patescibacteria group bacterium]MBU1758948.1 hypothetical protein [Patescibacteria group bacterium]